MLDLMLNDRNDVSAKLKSVVNTSNCYSFTRNKEGKVSCHKDKATYKLRAQSGWGKIWQKIFTTKDDGMSLGISVIESQGKMENIPVAVEFCDFLLYGKGMVEIDELGSYKLQEGDFLNFKKDIVRSSQNDDDDVVIGMWFIKSAPTYNFNEEERQV